MLQIKKKFKKNKILCFLSKIEFKKLPTLQNSVSSCPKPVKNNSCKSTEAL